MSRCPPPVRRCAPRPARTAQSGAVLVVATVLLMVVTLFVLSSFSFSVTDIKAVSNLQAQDEATAAAREALEVVTGSDFSITQDAQTLAIDINNDGTDDYQVSVDAPVCQKVQPIGGSVGLDDASSSGLSASSGAVYTLWDIRAVATDVRTGVRVEVHDGLMVKLAISVQEAVCPTS